METIDKSYQRLHRMETDEIVEYAYNLEQELDQANKKLEEIKEYCESNINYYNDLDECLIKQCEVNGLDILSIIDMNNKEKLVSSEGE